MNRFIGGILPHAPHWRKAAYCRLCHTGEMSLINWRENSPSIHHHLARFKNTSVISFHPLFVSFVSNSMLILIVPCSAYPGLQDLHRKDQKSESCWRQPSPILPTTTFYPWPATYTWARWPSARWTGSAGPPSPLASRPPPAAWR